jgi:hypothetical protein
MITEDELTLYFIDNPIQGVVVKGSSHGRYLQFDFTDTIDVIIIAVKHYGAKPFTMKLKQQLYLKEIVDWYNNGVVTLTGCPKSEEFYVYPVSSKSARIISLAKVKP